MLDSKDQTPHLNLVMGVSSVEELLELVPIENWNRLAKDLASYGVSAEQISKNVEGAL